MPDKIFICMPFHNTYTNLYRYCIQSACQNINYSSLRIDDNYLGGNITHKIFEEIQSAPLIIFNISENKPDVMIELGYALNQRGNCPHNYPKILIIAEHGTNIPFLIKNHQILFYDKHNLPELQEKLEKTMKYMLPAPNEVRKIGFRTDSEQTE